LKYLFKFQKEKSFKIINCDKNVGNALISNELYNLSAFEFLNSEATFIELNNDPLEETINLIRNEINYLCSNNHISEKLKKSLLNNLNDSKLGSFRLLAKLHKPKFSWRPIVNCKSHPNSKICHIIDLILKPIVMKTETYLKDSQNLIQRIKDFVFDQEPFLYSLDIVSLYTNIRQEDATLKITDFMSRRLDSVNLNIFALYKLISLMFKTNVFSFDKKFYKQITGLPMGCICGPSVANLYVYILEIKWYYIERPLIYYRFIDDTFIALKDKLNLVQFQNNFDYLEFTENSGKTVNFLDLNIKYNHLDNKLEFSVYIKPTNSFNYLRTTSNHPPHIFTNIPKSLFIRNRRISSNYDDYMQISNLHIQQLVRRGYKYVNLIKLCKSIGSTNRDLLLPYKDKTNNFISSTVNNILYFSSFNYNLNIQNIIYKSFAISFKHLNFNLKFINKINCNLNNALVHNFKMKENSINFKTKQCKEKNCNICKFIYKSHYIKLDVDSNIKIKLMSNATCQTKNLIYIIICKKCNLFYIGETGKSLKTRISQHLNHIMKFSPFKKYQDKEVPKHFRKNGHKLSHFKVCIFRSDLNDSNERKKYELDLINRFNLNKTRCLNIFKAKRNNKFIYF
jgi:hypothetical protein